MTGEDLDALITRVRDSLLPPPVVRRQIREVAQVTIREAADACRVAPMTFLRWEHGKAQPRRAHALVYREFLDALRAAVA